MVIFFWILWTAEFILALWWLQSEMKLTRLKANPYVFVSLLYLIATLAFRFGAGLNKFSLAMVTIPAIPLAGILFIIIISIISGKRWN